MRFGPAVAGMTAILTMATDQAVFATEPPLLVEGSRIRIETCTGVRPERVTGTLLAASASELMLRPSTGSDLVVLPVDRVTRLEVSAGRARSKAAAIGAMVGAGLAGIFTVMNASSDGDDLCSGAGCITLFFVLGVPAATTGALVGAVVAPERWREAHVPGGALTRGGKGLALRAGPARGGAAVAVSYRF